MDETDVTPEDQVRKTMKRIEEVVRRHDECGDERPWMLVAVGGRACTQELRAFRKGDCAIRRSRSGKDPKYVLISRRQASNAPRWMEIAVFTTNQIGGFSTLRELIDYVKVTMPRTSPAKAESRDQVVERMRLARLRKAVNAAATKGLSKEKQKELVQKMAAAAKVAKGEGTGAGGRWSLIDGLDENLRYPVGFGPCDQDAVKIRTGRRPKRKENR